MKALALGVALVLLFATPALAHTEPATPPTKPPKTLVWWWHCSQRNVRPCIRYAARRYHQSYSYALSVASCESTLNPHASNGTHFGLYQFDGATWAGQPFHRHSVWSARWAALGAMWYWARGEISRWTCA